VVDAFLRHSPLAHLGLAGRATTDQNKADDIGVAMGERPFRGIVNLRGPAEDEAFGAAAQTALGVALPVAPNTTASDGQVTVLWLAPDEWWVVTPGDGSAMADKLRRALEGVRSAVTDVSESRTCIEVRGPRARDLLVKGCPLDLHPRMFGKGECAQSHLAKTMITLHMTTGGDHEDGPAFDLYVLNSFAEYLWLWLEDAAREYGLKVTGE
jgi:sarcosine oxidase subunit gamma